LSVGVISTYLIVVVVLPIAALVWESKRNGTHAFWQAVSSPEALGALKLTFGAAFVVVLINAVLGTITAWVLVRDDFRGKSLVNSVIDLPFALPTIVAGLTLLTLYGPSSPVGINIAFTRAAIVLALCFVTLPFVIRTVQPVLLELDVEMEEAARSLGAGQFTVFRRIVLPNILPGILSGAVLAFARALGEIGAIVLVAGSSLHTQVASVFIFKVIQDGESAEASAVAIVLLGAAFVVLLAIGALRFYFTRHERA
jgi:sulfate/thiosulfate transport system permease protein